MIAPSQKKKIRDVLKSVYFTDKSDVVEVSDGEVDDLHLLVVSRKFKGLGPAKRIDMVWNALEEGLSQDDWGKITITFARTPDERDPLENLR